MFDPTRREVDADLRHSMELFERAAVGDVSPLELPTLKKLLVVLDGSSQDPLSLSLAETLRRRLQATLDVLDGREGDAGNELAERPAADLNARLLQKRSGESYEQILAAIDETECDLVVTPSPFGRDLDKIGTDSTGTVVDVLLARARVPILITRQPYVLEAELFEQVLLVLTAEHEVASKAASWAAALVAPQGSLQLLLILKTEVMENVQSMVRSLAPNADVSEATLGEALQRSYACLHRSIQKTAEQLGITYELQVRPESDPQLRELVTGEQHPLLVLAHARRDSGSQGNVHDRIRNSPHPVLVVSSD